MPKPGYLILALVLLGLGYAGAARLLGQQVESALDAQYRQLQGQPNLKIVDREYKRGWWRSQAKVVVELYGEQARLLEEMRKKTASQGRGSAAQPPSTPLIPIRLTVRSKIVHGPLPGSLTLAAGLVESEVELDGQAQQVAAKLFGDQSPLHVTTLFRFDGGGVATMISPACAATLPAAEEGNDLSCTWGGLRARLEFAPNLDRYRLSAEAPKLEFTDSRGARLSLNGLGLRSEQRRIFADEPLLYAGSQHVTIGQLSVAEAAAKKDEPLSLRQLVVDAELPVNGEFVDLDLKMGAEVVQVGAQDYGPAHYDLAFRHLHARSLATLYRTLVDLSSQPGAQAKQGDPAKKLLAPLVEPGLALLHYDPDLRLERLSFQRPDGEARLSARLRLPGVKAEDFATPARLVAKLEISADLALPETLFIELGCRGAASPELAAQKAAILKEQLAALVERGFISRQGGLLSSKLTVKNGQLMANDKPFGPPREGANGAPPP